MSKPEALRPADLLEMGSIWQDQEKAAAELRRLHQFAEDQIGRATAAEAALQMTKATHALKIAAVEAQRDALLEALRELLPDARDPNCGGYDARDVRQWRATAGALRAALAQQDEPVDGACLHGVDDGACKECYAANAEPVAWVASKDSRVIYDDASTDDGLLRVSGDFENDEQRVRYVQQIVNALNAAPPQRKPLTKERLLYIYNQLPNWGMDMDSLPQGLEKFARAVEHAHGIKE